MIVENVEQGLNGKRFTIGIHERLQTLRMQRILIILKKIVKTPSKCSNQTLKMSYMLYKGSQI